jgi:hypothetical protein
MESTSLSDYIYENGEPILAGKAKDLPKGFKNPKISHITTKMLKDKMNLQDFPMLAIMTIHFFATFGGHEKQQEMIVSLIQIATTALSICSGLISLKWISPEKGVDLKSIGKKIIDRNMEMSDKFE